MNKESRKIIERLRELRPILENDFGIKRLRVFGSVARGEATAQSDVDLIVEFETLPDWSYFTMNEKIGHMLGGVDVDLAMESELHHYLKDNILSEAQDVWQ